ncbi:hypothetical protein JCM14076_24570 [Methylosoma difficile]
MNLVVERTYRKNLHTKGLIFMNGAEYEVVIKNLSITGALAEFHSVNYSSDVKDIFSNLQASTKHDLYLPELSLAGEVEIVRVDSEGDYIFLALEFKNVSHHIDSVLYKRKAYRKSIADTGKILIDGVFVEFTSVNVSVDGLMIEINQAVSLPENTLTHFAFQRLSLEGEIKVVWVEQLADNKTLMGLKYVKLGKIQPE